MNGEQRVGSGLAGILIISLLMGCGAKERAVDEAIEKAMRERMAQRVVPAPLPGHPGNIFLEGEAVAVELPRSLDWVCLDFERKRVRQGSGSVAELGPLPVGYYEVYPAGNTDLGPGEMGPWPISLGVLARLKAPTPLDSPVSVDAPMGFYFEESDEEPLRQAANQIALAGVNWVRDRMSWQTLHPGPEEFATDTRFDLAARVYREAGLPVLQVLPSRPPEWMEKDGHNRFPADLRDAYAILHELANRWRGQVRAWEPWNEPEWIAFGGHTGAEIASLQKASYWAVRRGNPDALVSFIALTAEDFEHTENIIENEPWGYFDTFNYHQYFGLHDSERVFALMREAAGGNPEWITETGIELRWKGPGEWSELSWEDQLKQARHVPKTFAVNLYYGIDNVFFFLMPHYPEGANQFGITRKDRSPRPAYVALAAAGRLLAGAEGIGKLEDPDRPGLKVYHLRAKPDGVEREVSMVWSEAEPVEYALPAADQLVAAFDLLGRPLEISGDRIEAGPGVQYLVYNTGVAGDMDLIPSPQPVELVDPKPSPVVIQPSPYTPQKLRGSSRYGFSPGETVTFPLHVYNFSDEALEVEMQLESSPQFRISAEVTKLSLPALGRVPFPMTVTAGEATGGLGHELVRISAQGAAAGKTVLALRFSYHRHTLPMEAEIPINADNDVGRWELGASSGPVESAQAPDGGIHVKAHPREIRGHAYGELKLGEEERAHPGIQGLAFTVTPLVGTARYDVLFTEEAGNRYYGFAYMPSIDQVGKAYRCIVLFDGTEGTTNPKPDTNGRLDPEQITHVRVGCAPDGDPVEWEVRDLAWVQFAE